MTVLTGFGPWPEEGGLCGANSTLRAMRASSIIRLPFSPEISVPVRLSHTFEYVIDAYRNLGLGEKFFTRMFLLLTGVDYIKEMIIAGNTADEIRARWQKDVEDFKVLRRKYLLYEE